MAECRRNLFEKVKPFCLLKRLTYKSGGEVQMKQMLDKILKTISVPSDLNDCIIQAIERVKKGNKGQ